MEGADNLKFRSTYDAQLFLTEIQRVDLVTRLSENFEPTAEMLSEFVKRRKKMVNTLKDFKRSQASKANWRANRFKMMDGIKRFHASTEGKKFHRQLGRFLASRHNFKKYRLLHDEPEQEQEFQTESFNFLEVRDIMKALSSLKTHCFIEFDYYMPLEEMVDWQIFIEETIPVLERIESAILKNTKGISDEDYDYLIRLCNERFLSEELAQLHPQIEGYWEACRVNSDYLSMATPGQYLRLLQHCWKEMENG